MPSQLEILEFSPQKPSFSADLLDLSGRLFQGIRVKLSLTDELTDLEKFTQWLESIPEHSISKLSLPLSFNLLQSDAFLVLIKTLKNKYPKVVEFDFRDAKIALDTIEKTLMDKIVPIANFPIQIKGRKLEKFQAAMIQNIQAASKTGPSLAASGSHENAQEAHLNASGKKIRLKALMQASKALSAEEYKQFINVDVEHVAEIAQNQEEQEEVQVEQQVEQQAAYYMGKILNFAEFKVMTSAIVNARFGEERANSAYELIHHELFANLPHSIKFLTPNAAQKLATNLPQWAAINKDNCAPFVLKQNFLLEYVLDYELDDAHEQEKPFALHEFSPDEDQEPYYNVHIQAPNQEVANTLFKNGFKNLTNLWIRYGDEGLKTFSAKLKRLDRKHEGLSAFIYEHYLKHFAQLEPFYQEDFFEALRKLESYSPLQINCLKRFLNYTGSSQHHLAKTLEAFDCFWQKFRTLCKDDEELMQGLNNNWRTPTGGQPAVYMQRLLTILEKAKQVPDQLKSLDGITLSQYGAYYASAYEGFTEVHPAMGFNYSPDAKFNDQRFNRNLNLYRFDLNTLCDWLENSVRIMTHHIKDFGEDLWFIQTRNEAEERLIESTTLDKIEHKILLRDYMLDESLDENRFKNYVLYWQNNNKELIKLTYGSLITKKALGQLVHRWIGQQRAGISVQDFVHSYETYTKNRFADHKQLLRLKFRLLQCLFFITSERYSGRLDINRLGRKDTFTELMEDADISDQTLETVEKLKQLFANNVKFSNQEAYFYQAIQWTHNSDLEPSEEQKTHFFKRVKKMQGRKNNDDGSWWRDARASIQNHLFNRLMKNKYPVFKFLNLIGPHYSQQKQVFLFAFNTEEFLAEIPQIKRAFADDLLAFSAQLVNADINLIESDFKAALQTQDKDIIQLKQIRDYLYKASQGEPANNYLHYTVTLLMDSNELFTYEKVLTVLEQASKLENNNNPLNIEAVHEIFKQHKIPIRIKAPEFTHCSENLKKQLIELIIRLELEEPQFSPLDLADPQKIEQKLIAARLFQQQSEVLTQELAALKFDALQIRFTKTLSASSLAVRLDIAVQFKKMLNELLFNEINHLFFETKPAGFRRKWIQYTLRLSDLRDCANFEDVNKAAGKAQPLVLVYQALLNNPCIIAKLDEFLKVFDAIKFEQLDSDLLYYWLDFLSKMPQRDYLGLLQEMTKPHVIYNKTAFRALIRCLEKLNAAQFTTEAMVGFCKLYNNYPAKNEHHYDPLIAQLAANFAGNNNDPLVAFLLRESEFSLPQVVAISAQTTTLHSHREQLLELYRELQRQKTLDSFLNLNVDAPMKRQLLTILALAYSGRRPQDPSIDLIQVVKQLQTLSPANLEALNHHYDSTLMSLSCLSNALSTLNKASSFSDFLQKIERAPFGLRDLEEQYGTKEVTRVVNSSLDLVNNTAYPYQYRKQLMEIFLLINDLGHSLPVYQGKAAKDLSNIEIKELFAAFKAEHSGYSKTQKRILALTLMREAMYRSTGQFPYSTQMISLIDCMLHRGDVISNIDTGQGKSLIDVMKAAFLWLESERVDLSTSSLVDAARDIGNYAPFLSLLNIPFAKKPIEANSSLQEICLNGINFSTFSQLALRFSKALAYGESIDPANQKVSLVLNESDHALLDDRAIKRLANSQGINIAKKNPWIYEAINEFVSADSFKTEDTSADEDVHSLRRYLMSQAKLRNKKVTFINRLDKETLITWIESAILVNYKLRENVDYVIVPVPEKAGQWVAKVLMADNRPSPDSVFGKGMQQLLHARLNKDSRFKKKNNEVAFEISPENRTLISTNNRTLVNYYRSKKGFIWGSSGTVGSDKEIKEQYAKYGFAFSKIEPHQKKQVTESPVVILKGVEAHYQRLATELQKKRKALQQAPTLIFCESIDKAKEIYAYLVKVKALGEQNIQLNQGTDLIEAEKKLIKNAATPGMCTITTAAIGRNTDIPYDKTLGLDVWFTSVASTRLDRQKQGRTGRQGSPGALSYFFNENDQGIKTDKGIETLREQLDAAGEKERDYQETLYKVMGYFLTELGQMPPFSFTGISKLDFIQQKWPKFSEQLEQDYRELVLKKEFQEERFAEQAKIRFIALLQENVPQYDGSSLRLSRSIAQKTSAYNPYTKAVTLSDCTPALDIAYQLFHQQIAAEKELSPEQEKAFLKELNTLFSEKGKTPTQHFQFFNKVLGSHASSAALRTVYQNFLKGFLSAKQPSWFFMRWLGFHTPLNSIADNPHYLVLFRALASIDKAKPIIAEGDIKTMAVAMIEEYLQNSWWISKDKRIAAQQLQNSIHNSPDMEAVITAICESQVAIAKRDSALAKNYFGNSRLQNTLSKILTMATALGIHTKTEDLVTKIAQCLNAAQKDQTQEPPTIDSALQQVNKTTGNAKVLAKSLEKALQLERKKHQNLPGMEEREPLDPNDEAAKQSRPTPK